MACKDKENDARIIAEIERRKSLVIEPQIDTYSIACKLHEIPMYVDEDKIVDITKIDNTWIIKFYNT